MVAWGTNVSTPFLVLYKDRLDLNRSATVGIFVIYVFGILGALLVAGPLSDRYGRRPLVLPFVALSAFASVVLVLGRDSFVLLLLGRLLLGAVSGVVLGVGSAWMLELLGKGNELTAALFTTIITFLGFGFGPLTSAVYERFFDAPLVVPFLMHVAVTVLVLPFAYGIPETHDPIPEQPIRVRLGVPPEARSDFFRIVLPAAVWVFAFPSTAFALFPVLLSEAIDGSEVLIAGACGTLTSWASLLARPVVGRVKQRWLLSTGMASGVVGYIFGTIAFATDTWPFALPAAVLAGLASAIITSGCLKLLGEMADDESRGKLTSTFYLLAYPGMAMPLFITTLGALWTVAGALMLVTTVAAVLTARAALLARTAL